MTKISPTTDGFTDYLISSSDKGLELFSTSATLESIKILPKDKMEFIIELRKRCPNTQIQKFELMAQNNFDPNKGLFFMLSSPSEQSCNLLKRI
ncbi:hypothetical protein ACFVP8_06255 [Viridibacillus arvi]|uniref:hypothetical protein n=1 Tax=Viridibacillus arvi TaxID=263475 RepID=UPI003679F379